VNTRNIGVLFAACAGTFLAQERTFAQTTIRVSVDSNGVEGNRDSRAGGFSADGRYALFSSLASNLVPHDTNDAYDVFVFDRSSGQIDCVSVTEDGVPPIRGGAGGLSSISGDGRFVAFSSDADDLVPGDTNLQNDVFVRDRTNGTTERVSVDSAGAEANGYSASPSITPDGRFVAFWSDADNLAPGDTHGWIEIYVHDRTTGATERVSVDANGDPGNGDSLDPVLSDDGRIVAFESQAANLVPGDTNFAYDVFAYDRSTHTMERISVDANGGQVEYGLDPAISADGRFVAFCSGADNLVAGDTNLCNDVFVKDRATGAVERVSVDSNGAEVFGESYCFTGAISADGSRVAFLSDASTLVPGDYNGARDVFVHDRATGVTELVSRGTTGRIGDAYGIYRDLNGDAMISRDGRFVEFTSAADHFVPADTNAVNDVFVRECGPVAAAWSNYGDGFSGTAGVPTFVASANPVLGSDLALDLGNSSSLYTVGALVIGLEPAHLPSSWVGELVVLPAVTMLVGISPWGATLLGSVPADASFGALEFDLQVLEMDPGAEKGISFTQGLALVLGH
jgi:Tol biopolymer transport system component